MGDLNSQNYERYFQELWGYSPFAWQHALAQRLLEGEDGWPEAIALPTSAGKTACLDTAVFVLAAQAHRIELDQPLTAPRRIFFVVDRRIIVDEAYERARRLAQKLCTAESGILKTVADRLRRLANGDLPLACHQLRGGMYRSDAWARNPIQPTIVASTVDQIGSRLLFRAYGRSFKAWPIQAGLAANDSLILLDEAHCSQPFLETLQAIGKYRHWAKTPLDVTFQNVIMSATPGILNPKNKHLNSVTFQNVIMSATPPPGVSDIFCDNSTEPNTLNHPLGKRQLAGKPTVLRVVEKAKGKSAGQELAKALAEEAEALVQNWQDNLSGQRIGQGTLLGEPCSAPATVIFCNRVATARAVHAILQKRHGERAVLLTGRMRSIDKDAIINGPIAVLAADKSMGRVLQDPLFVIATQTLEVGANLDFDLLVTECASLDALRQRFGRLNRMGRAIQAMAAILIRLDQSQSSVDDPVYGESLSNTWQWLTATATANHELDMGIAAMQQRLADQDLIRLNAPSRHAPVLLPSHVDVLVQTAPEPYPTPEIALFLHGPTSGPADVQVCWRADLTTGNEDLWADTLILCPPAAPECLAVPFNQLRRWLAGEAADQGVDVEGVESNDEPRNDKKTERKVLRWRGRKDVRVVHSPFDLRPGDVVVIPADYQGWQDLATLGTEKPTADWGDQAYLLTRDRAILRLQADVIDQYPSCNAVESLREAMKTAFEHWEEDPDQCTADLKILLTGMCEDASIPPQLDWLGVAAKGMLTGFRILLHPAGGFILLGRNRLNLHSGEADTFSDEDDPASSGTVWSPLEDHLLGTATLAAQYAKNSGLSQDLVKIMENAALFHDTGKADPRFQAWLRNGNPWLREPLLAKSETMHQGRTESESARKRAGYPEGGRHELLSVRLMESNPSLLPTDNNANDLLLHLVGSHHGHCRPFAPPVIDDNPVSVDVSLHGGHLNACSKTDMEWVGSGAAERFWRLTRRYGWWGLAWMEAIVRLADHRRSEWEENTPQGRGNV